MTFFSLVFLLELIRFFLQFFMEHFLKFKFFAKKMLESWVVIVELVFEFFNVNEENFALFSIDFHGLKTIVFLQYDLFNADYFRILYI